ncbi:MAG: InlB B-repeat-containing protein [Bacillota bacterium]|nr:InlB B-repeat-containing protein [Bacillota bacterium]
MDLAVKSRMKSIIVIIAMTVAVFSALLFTTDDVFGALTSSEYEVSKDGKTVYIDPNDYEGDTASDKQTKAGYAFILALRDIQTDNGDAKNANTIIIYGDIRVKEGQNQSSWNPTVAKMSVTIKGDGKPTIWVENYHNYFLRGYRSNITLENLVIDGSGNTRLVQGGCLYGEDAKFTLRNVTIQNFTKLGEYDDGLSAPDDYGNRGEGIYGGAAVMLFTESFSGSTEDYTPWSSFEMDENSKIINCYSKISDVSGNHYEPEAIGGAVYLEGIAQNYPMNVELNGEIDGGNGSAVYAKWCDISMGNKAYIHDAYGEYGGAMQLSGSGLTMNGSKIEDCEATYGGALYIDAGEQRNSIDANHPSYLKTKIVHLNSGTIQNCTATKDGGAVYADKYKMKAGSVHDKENVMYDEYGYNPIDYSGDYPYITFGDMNLYNNSAEYGGAIYNNKSYIEIKGGTLSGNAASKDGGAVYKTKKASVILSGGVFENNTAEGKGQDIYAITISNVHDYLDINDREEEKYAQGHREYLYVKGSPEIYTPIHINNAEDDSAEEDPSPVQVLGPVKKTLKFDFEAMGKDNGTEHDPLILGCGTTYDGYTDKRNNNASYLPEKYDITYDDFMNLIIAQIDSYAVSYNGGRSDGEYGKYFPAFFKAEDKIGESKLIYNSISAVDKTNLYNNELYNEEDTKKLAEKGTIVCRKSANDIIYISSNGDDNGDGSKEKPVKSYNKARQLMKDNIQLVTIDEQGNDKDISDIYYINSIASLTPLTPEMGVPSNMKEMVWYQVDHPGASIHEVPGDLAREGKELTFEVNWPDGYEFHDNSKDDVTWMVLKGDMPRSRTTTDFKGTNYIGIMPAEPVMILADSGQVNYIKSMEFDLSNIPDPDNYTETSFLTIKSAKAGDRNSNTENLTNLTNEQIIATFGSLNLPVKWKVAGAEEFGFDEDQAYAVFSLDTGFIKNAGNGYAIAEDIEIKVNNNVAAKRVNSFENCDVAHKVDSDKIPELEMPEVSLNGEKDVNVSNKGTTSQISLIVSGIYKYTKPVRWTISEVSDKDNILTLPEQTSGDLPTGNNKEVSLGDIIIKENKVGEGAKTASVRISFSKEDGILNYKDMPDDITITYNLAKGDDLPKIQANINYEDETLEITRKEGLEDYIVEYVIVEEGTYDESVWKKTNKVKEIDSNSEDISDYIVDYDEAINVIYVRYAQLDQDPGPGEVNVIEIPARPEAPDFDIDYKAETTDGIVPVNTIYGTAKSSLTETGTGEPIVLTPGIDMYFRYKADVNSFASEIQKLRVSDRPSAAELTEIGINYGEEVTNKAIKSEWVYGNSQEEVVAETYEGQDKAVALTPGTNMFFAVKSTANSFRSDAIELEVPERPEKTAFTVNYSDEKTNEQIPSTVQYGYTENTMDTVGNKEKLDLEPGKDIFFFKTATNSTFKSDPQHLVVKERRGAPDVEAVNEDIWGEGDGKIKGLDAAAEYRKAGESGWTNNGSSNTINNLTTGTYEVRYVPTPSEFVSYARTVEISHDRTITVEFDSNKGTGIEKQTGLKYGSKITKPSPDPQKTNCEFVKWCEDALLLNEWNFANDTVKDNTKLHAKWKRNKMDTPENLKWSKNTAKWDSVNDEDEYVVRLYKDGSHVETVETKKNSYDMADLMKNNGSGDYKFTVVAVSTGLFGSDIKDSDVANSDTRTYYKAPDITKQPVDYETTETTPATFTAGATVDRNETLSYQWQRKEDGSGKWKDIDDANGTEYKIKESVLSDGDYDYRCKIEDEKDNEVFTNEVSLIVNKKPEVNITASVNPVERSKETELTANVSYGTGKMTYKWTDEDGSITQKITVKLKKTSKLKVTVTDERGISASGTISITVEKSQAEIILEEMLSIEDLLYKVDDEDATSGHIYYLMKTAVEGYEALSSEEKDALNEYLGDNRLEELYDRYKAAIEKSDEFTAKVEAITSPFSPSTRAEIEVLAQEMETLLSEGVPVATHISDPETGRIAELQGMLENTRDVQKMVMSLIKEILSQMDDDEMSEFKSTMRSYIDGLPETQDIPGLGEYLKQLVSGETEMSLGSYLKSLLTGKSSKELEAFKDALLEKLNENGNKEEAIQYLCDTLVANYETANDASIKETLWAYNGLHADERNMVAPVLAESVRALYDKVLEVKPGDELKAIAFEELLAEVEADPTIDSITGLETAYNKLTDSQKTLLTEEEIASAEKLIEDKNAASEIAAKLIALDTAKVREILDKNNGKGGQDIVEAYQDLTDERKALIKDALGRKADNVIGVISIIKKVKALDRDKMSNDEYWDGVEEVVKDANLLSDKAQDILKEAYLNNDSEAAAEFKEWRDNYKFSCKASTVKTTIEVIGVSNDNLKKIASDNNYTEFKLQATDINFGKLSGSGEGKEPIVAVDTSLLLTRENNNGSYTVKDAELKNPVQVKMALPNNYQLESMELWNVTDDNSVNYIKDVTFVWEESQLYIVFETKVFGQFIVYAKDITTSADIFVGGTKLNESIGEIELDTYYNTAQTASLNVKDGGLGAASVQYYVSSSIYDYEGIKKIDGWKDYSGQFTLETNKNHVIYVKLTDTLGNISYVASKGIIIDDIAPSITGVTNRNYCTSPTMTVKDTNLKTTTVGGKSVNLSNGQYTIPVGTHEIVATDIAGNSTKVTVTVFDGHKPSTWQDIDEDTHRKYCEGCGAEVNKEDHKFNQKVVDGKHLKKAATYNDEGTYYKSCVCGRTDNTLIKGTFKGGGLKYDGVPPTVTISVKNETNKKIKYKVEMSDGQSGMYRRYHYDAGAPMDVNGVKAITGWERLTLNIKTFSIKKDKTKAVYAKAVDEQGNYTIIDQNNNIVYQYVH